VFNLEFTFIKDDIPIDDHDDVEGFINEAFVDEDIGTYISSCKKASVILTYIHTICHLNTTPLIKATLN